MTQLSPRSAVFVWSFLVIATLCTAWLAEHHGAAGHWTAAVVMLVAALKGRAIVLYYMELKDAPLAWRLVFEAWLAIATLVILAFWALSAGNS